MLLEHMSTVERTMSFRLLQYMTKKDYMPFFERYYWGIEMPKD